MMLEAEDHALAFRIAKAEKRNASTIVGLALRLYASIYMKETVSYADDTVPATKHTARHKARV